MLHKSHYVLVQALTYLNVLMLELFIYGLNGLCLSECLVMVNVVYRCHIYCLQAMSCPFLMAVNPDHLGFYF